MKYLKSFQLKDTSEEGRKVLGEVFARKIERQGKYGCVVTPPEVTAGHLRTLSASFQLSPSVHRQLFVNPKVQQSSELLKGQLTLLPGRSLEQLYTEQPTQGKPHLTTLTSQFTPGTVLHSSQLMACSSISSPLVLCIASLCGKTTSVCPSLRHSRLLLISVPSTSTGKQHLSQLCHPWQSVYQRPTACAYCT